MSKKNKSVVELAEEYGLLEDDDIGEYFKQTYRGPDEENEEPMPSFTVAPYELGNKKTAALDALADDLIRVNRLIVADGDQLFLYDPKNGYYRRAENPERLIARLLSEGGYLARLSSRDVHEVYLKILWNHSIQHPADDFNCRKLEINTVDGILNFQSGLVKEHSPEYLFTYVINARYIPVEERRCPAFDQFCQTSLAPLYSRGKEIDQAIVMENRQLFLESTGYSCSDSPDGKCALVLMGEPDSGKSIVLNFITRLFHPDLISNIPLHKLSDRFNKAALFGKKINIAGEIQGKKLVEIATFKSITGGDTISAEFKGKDPFSFKPRCKLIFAGNALPGTLEADATKAFSNRLVVLLFNHSIPKEKQDKDLLDKLWAERDSIFSWSMDALRDLHMRNYQFTLPEESKLFLDGFTSRGTSFQAFLKDRCQLSQDARVFNTELYAAYEKYCMINGLDKLSRQKFYDMLSGIPGVVMKRLRIGSENRCGHVGIQLREEGAK